MNRMMPKSTQKGFTIIELLAAMVSALLISLAVVNVIAAHTTALYAQARANQAAEDGMETYALVSRLFKQAQRANITFTNGEDSSTLDLSVPAGFQIWPNVVEPYTDNWVRLAWSNTGDNASQLTVANAASSGALAAATPVPLAGDAAGDNTSITGFSVTDDDGDGSYLLTITLRSAITITGPEGETTFGSTSFEGIVIPRN